jgi:antitoxin PrlF
VRNALRLREGDKIAYIIEYGRVILTRAEEAPDDPFQVFSEWASDADGRAYDKL